MPDVQKSMASSSRAPGGVPLSVLEPAYGDAVFDHANFFVGCHLPKKLAKDSFFIRLNEIGDMISLEYLTSMGSLEQIDINTPDVFQQHVARLRQQGDIQLLDSAGIQDLIQATGSDYALQSEAIRVARFEQTIYAPDRSITYSESRQAYFEQIKRLLQFMKDVLLPYYHAEASTEITTLAVRNMDTFLARIQKHDFVQPPELFDQSKHLLATLCYIFSLDSSRNHADRFAYLCQQLGRCGPGTLISIVEVYLAIKGEMSADIPDLLAGFRELVFSTLMMEHALTKAVPSQKTIHLSAMMRPWANQFGFNLTAESNVLGQLQDELVSYSDLKIHPEITSAWLFQRFNEKFNRTAIIDLICVNMYSALKRANVSSLSGLNDFMDQIDEGRSMLSPLFKMPAPHLSMPLLFALPGVAVRRDAARTLRAFVERRLILDGYISYDRPVRALLNIHFPRKRVMLAFTPHNGKRQELSDLVEKTMHHLSKNSGVRVTRHAYKVLVDCEDLKKSAYPVLLAAADIQEEYDLDRDSLVSSLDALENAGMLTRSEHQFLLARLDTSRHSLADTPAELDPVYCVADQDDALALLEWSTDADARDPAFLSLARSITGEYLLPWAIKNEVDEFIQALIDHPDFDELRDANPVLFESARSEWPSLLTRWHDTDRRDRLEPLITRLSLVEQGIIDAMINSSAHPQAAAWLSARYARATPPHELPSSTALSSLGLFSTTDAPDTAARNDLTMYIKP
ncbi:hypothetical protein [Legionella sp. CNM-4043-24]|uniref:hypothetical protein n=1 Tax=Legionella sp. CNM-4043-24 TaxID=3421646 RepID=UPI00403B0FBF